MEALSLHTGAQTVNWENNTSFISVVKAKMLTPTVKQIDIPVFFLQEKFYNGLFVPKYENYGVIPADICTKPCSGSIISPDTKWMTGFIFYPTSDTEHYQLMILHDFVVNLTNYLELLRITYYEIALKPE